MNTHKDNPYELLDVYDEIYRRENEDNGIWALSTGAARLLLCPNCTTVLDVMTSYCDPGILIECPVCGYQDYMA